MRTISSLVLAASVLCLVGAGRAPAADFYQGKTLKVIVGAAAGGPGDIRARLVANRLAKHIAGNPAIVVQNMPAAGGMAAINHVFNVSPKDGTELGVMNRNTILAPLLGMDAAKFDVAAFNWLGTPVSYSDNAYVFLMRSALPYKTIAEMRGATKPLNVGNNATAITEVLPDALGIKMNIIRGYSRDQLNLAMERGEIDGLSVDYAYTVTNFPRWLSDNMVRVMLQFGHDQRLPVLPDVPTGRESAISADGRALLEFAEAPLTLGNPFALPPGAPAESVAILRKAFHDTVNDPEYKADVQKSGVEHSPKDGDEMQKDMASMAKISPRVIDLYKKLMAEGGVTQ
jgi:tripartite-type tricarboxylate transporter receptor subunit TctC